MYQKERERAEIMETRLEHRQEDETTREMWRDLAVEKATSQLFRPD